MEVESNFYNYNVDFGSITVLINNKYKLDNKYDISKSHLYSVIASAGDYTIISEPNIGCTRIVLYHRNEPSFIFSDTHLGIDNWGDILFVKAFNKQLVLANKNKLINTNKINKYYIYYNSSGISIIDNKVVRNWLLSSITQNNNTDWVSIDMTDIVKHIHLEDKLEGMVRHYACHDGSFTFFLYSYYIDYDEEELYALVYFQCIEMFENNLPDFGKFRLCLFRCKISSLYNDYGSCILISQFEFDIHNPPNNISNMLHNKAISGDYGKVLRLLIKKWNTMNAISDLKVFEIYDKRNAYYDYKYNRKSIQASPIDTALYPELHLVRRIMPTF